MHSVLPEVMRATVQFELTAAVAAASTPLSGIPRLSRVLEAVHGPRAAEMHQFVGSLPANTFENTWAHWSRTYEYPWPGSSAKPIRGDLGRKIAADDPCAPLRSAQPLPWTLCVGSLTASITR